MAADSFAPMIGARHHDRGVPSDHRTDASLDVLVAREPRFFVAGDGVHVGRRYGGGESHLLRPGPLDELHEQEPRPWSPVRGDDRVERVEPFGRLGGIDVWQLVGNSVEQHENHAPTVQRSRGTTGGQPLR